MEIQVLVSKKGTKVVTANQLHRALRLVDYRYNNDTQKWLNDLYSFSDGVRQPVEMQDYSKRTFKYAKMPDYYLSVELAILITLRSNSPVKQFYAKYLIALNTIPQDKVKTNDRTNNTQKVSTDPVLLNNAASLPKGIQLGLW